MCIYLPVSLQNVIMCGQLSVLTCYGYNYNLFITGEHKYALKKTDYWLSFQDTAYKILSLLYWRYFRCVDVKLRLFVLLNDVNLKSEFTPWVHVFYGQKDVVAVPNHHQQRWIKVKNKFKLLSEESCSPLEPVIWFDLKCVFTFWQIVSRQEDNFKKYINSWLISSINWCIMD